MTREEAKALFRDDVDSYGKPKKIMSKINQIYDEFEAREMLLLTKDVFCDDCKHYLSDNGNFPLEPCGGVAGFMLINLKGKKMKIKRLHPDAVLPHYATDGASAFDVFAYEDVEWKYIGSQWEAVIPTGWAFEIPHEHGLFIFSRSGHGFKHSTTLVNSVGLLDFDYRGELMVKLICFSNIPPEIKAGTAVAQCVLMPTPRVYFCEVDELSDTERGKNGFGSTGL